MRQNRFGGRYCPAIVKKSGTQAETPQRCGSPFRAVGAALDNPVIESRPHVVQQQIRVQRNVAPPGWKRWRVTGNTPGGREQLQALLVWFRSLQRGWLGQWCRQGRKIRGHGANNRSVVVKSGTGLAAAIIGCNCDVLRGKRTRYSDLVAKCVRYKLLKTCDIALPAKPPDAFPPLTIPYNVRPPLRAGPGALPSPNAGDFSERQWSPYSAGAQSALVA